MTAPAVKSDALPATRRWSRSPVVAGTLFGLTAVAMWGAYLAFARAGVNDGLGAIDFVVLRYVTASVIMFAWLLAHGGIGGLVDLHGVGWRRGSLLALTAGPLFIALGVGGYHYAPLSHGASIQPATLTVGGAVLAWLVLGERLGRGQILGAAVVLTGIALVARPGTAPAGAWMGDLMFVAAGLLFVAFTLMVRAWRIAPLPATAAVSLVSLPVALVAYAVWGEPTRLLALSPPALLTQIVVQGVLSGVLAIVAFTAAVARLGAARAALFPALVPAATLVIGIPVTGEVPTMGEWIGIALATLGLAITVALPTRTKR